MNGLSDLFNLGNLIFQSSILLQRDVKTILEEHDINYSQLVIMQVVLMLESEPAINSQTSIIKISKLDKMTVSKSLEKLSNDGLVTRKEGEIDTRSKQVFLTVEGRRLLNKLYPLLDKKYEAHYKKLSTQEVELVTKTLAKLIV